MVRIGKAYDREVRCLISDMNTPLGVCIGNSLEVAEVIEVLEGKSKNNLYNLCVDIASNMVSMAKGITIIEARKQVVEAIESHKALEKFYEFVEYQGGDINKMTISNNKIKVKSTKNGVIKNIDALIVSEVSFRLGSGRMSKEESIDHEVGVFINKKIGDTVKEGDVLCTLYYNKVKDTFNILDAFEIE
jgi:thymidine phosphorylase